jgi:hypothetical protein
MKIRSLFVSAGLALSAAGILSAWYGSEAPRATANSPPPAVAPAPATDWYVLLPNPPPTCLRAADLVTGTSHSLATPEDARADLAADGNHVSVESIPGPDGVPSIVWVRESLPHNLVYTMTYFGHRKYCENTVRMMKREPH